MKPYDFNDRVTTIERPKPQPRPRSDRPRLRPARSSDAERPATPKLPVITAIMFVIGLAATALGLAIIRSDLPFPWIPRQTTGFLAIYFPHAQAVLFGIAVAIVGGVLAGSVGRRVLPDALANLDLPVLGARRDLLAFGAILVASLCSGFVYWQLASHRYTHWDILL